VTRRPRDPEWRPKCFDCQRVGVELVTAFHHHLCWECALRRQGAEQLELFGDDA